MKLLTTVRLGALLLIGLNILMSLGSIWVFTRMAPAIETIIDRNERTLKSCESMLTALAMTTPDESAERQLQAAFAEALQAAEGNITEAEEPQALAVIAQNYRLAFTDDIDARGQTITAINRLAAINRQAMERADKRAKQLGKGGAWGVVFMTSAVFLAGLLFLRLLEKELVRPLREIYAVMASSQQGDLMRRCWGADMSKDIKTIFDGINRLLDMTRSKS